jgi:hypothetical protein
MTSWRDSIPSKWLKAADLGGKPHLVTIKRFSVETIGESPKPVVWFRELKKGLGLNITNGKRIEDICGSADPERWIGKHIVLFPTETEYKGETVDCIRVRAPKPGAKLPEPVTGPDDDSDTFTADDSDVPF